MILAKQGKLWMTVALCGILAACGGNSFLGPVGPAGDPGDTADNRGREKIGDQPGGSSIWDLFGPDTSDQTVNVNKYLWAASLDVLNFLPIQSVDPFTGVIVTGYGTPPGGGRAYRATVHISDPALEARSLSISLQSQSGPVAAGTARAVEDAVLARARQMRIDDNLF